MKAEQWLKWVLYLLAALVLLGLLDLVFLQVFSRGGMMGGRGAATAWLQGFVDFFFYSLLIVLVLLVVIGSVYYAFRLVLRLLRE